MDLDQDFAIWTIYERPADYPDGFVTRAWLITGHGPQAGRGHLAATLEEARGNVPPGLIRMERAPDDDPTIVETWL